MYLSHSKHSSREQELLLNSQKLFPLFCIPRRDYVYVHVHVLLIYDNVGMPFNEQVRIVCTLLQIVLLTTP